MARAWFVGHAVVVGVEEEGVVVVVVVPVVIRHVYRYRRCPLNPEQSFS